MLRVLLAAALLLAACGPRRAVPLRLASRELQVDPIERATITERASRSRVRPLQPPAAPDTRSPTAARPAPQRAQHRPPVPVQHPPVASQRASVDGCTGRMSRDRAHTCWDGLLAAYPWPTATAFRILYCESTGNPNAVNGRYHGLFQVEQGPYDPAANIAAAYGYYRRRGWQPWECR